MTTIAWVAVAIFVGAYVLIATERVHRVAASLGGAAIILGLGVTSSQDAFYSSDTGIDWDVIFLLLGMMLVVSIPIITLCALIILIIMVTLLDMVFKWLPFFMFWIPVKSRKGDATA